ncbi:hypothetical protein D3C75_1201530 [compost metagenome]
MLRRVEQAAIGEHQLQPLQLQGAVSQGILVHLQGLYPPVKRGAAQRRLSQLMLVELILILEVLGQQEHAL